jgi:hypothetical protein
MYSGNSSTWQLTCDYEHVLADDAVAGDDGRRRVFIIQESGADVTVVPLLVHEDSQLLYTTFCQCNKPSM